jgi:serine/threonine protein kinase
MPASTPAAEPRCIDRRYQLKEIIGRGGMGLVYKAFDITVRRDVALKTIRGSANRLALELFRKECSVLATLCHPNIVEIFDIGEFDEDGERKPYFVMPFLPGRALSDLISGASQRLTVERTVEIIVQTCRGLQAAHESNVVHRDLKPSNIFVMQDDSVKIIDFGIVHMTDSHTTMTIKGGTLPYMSPEQVQMQPASALSDLFSLGVILYETLTKRRPFEGSSESEVVEAILHRIPPPASDLNPAVSQLVSRVVHKAMAKQPWYRFSNAREFSEVLQKALRNEPIEIFDAIRIQPRMQRATKATEQGDYQFANEILGELEAEGHLDPAIPFLRTQIEKGKRQKTIAQLLESARTRIEEEEYLLALQKIEEVLQLDPTNVSALAVKNNIEHRRSEQKIDEWFRLARQHLDNHAFSHARDAMQTVLQLSPKDSRALQMLAEVDRKEQEYLRIRGEKEQLYKSALDAWQGGEVTGALSRLERLIELDRRAPDTSTPERGVSIQSLYNQVRSEHDAMKNAYEEARRYLGDHNFVMALSICDQYLGKYPGYPLFQALKFDVEERERQEWSQLIADIDRRVELEPDLNQRVSILKEALDLHPGEAHFERALRLMRDKRDLVQSIVNRARNLEERSQFPDALAQWEILQSVHQQYPGLEIEIGRLKDRRAQWARGEAKSRWVGLIDHLLESSDYSRAGELLEDALAEFPEDPELLDLQKLVQQGVERCNDARSLLAEAQDLFANRHYGDGIARLHRAYELDPRNSALRADLLATLLERARIELDAGGDAGDLLIEEVLTLDPDNTLGNSLKVIALDRKREEFVTQCVRQARQLQVSGKLEEALAEIERGLSLYPDEARLMQPSGILRRAVQELRGKRDEFVTRCLAQSQELRAAGNLQRAIGQAEQGLASYPEEPRLLELLASLQTALKDYRDHREEFVNLCVTEARKLQDAGDLNGAVAQIARGLASYPEEARLKDLQAFLKDVIEKSREDLVTRCIAQALKQHAIGDFEKALQIIDGGLSSYPEDDHLLRIRADLEKEAATQRQVARQQKITHHFHTIQQAMAVEDWGAAKLAIQIALREFPGEEAFRQPDEQVRKGLYQLELKQLIAQVRESLDRNELQETAEKLRTSREEFGDDPSWRALESEFKRRQVYEAGLTEAEQRRQDGDYVQGQQLLLSLADPPDKRAALLLNAITLEQKQKQHDQAINQGRVESERLRRKGDYAGAVAVWDRLCGEFPGDDGFVSERQIARRLESERREKIAAHHAAVQDALAIKDWPQARIAVQRAQHEFPSEESFKKLSEDVRQKQRQSEIEVLAETKRRREEVIIGCLDHARELLAAGDPHRALSQVDDTLLTYPGESRLLELRGILQNTVRDHQSRNELAIVAGKVREKLTAGDLSTARTLIDAANQAHPGEALIVTLKREVEVETVRREKLGEAQTLYEHGKLSKAEKICRELLAAGPGDVSAITLVERIAAQMSNRQGRRPSGFLAFFRSHSKIVAGCTCLVGILVFMVIRSSTPATKKKGSSTPSPKMTSAQASAPEELTPTGLAARPKTAPPEPSTPPSEVEAERPERSRTPRRKTTPKPDLTQMKEVPKVVASPPPAPTQTAEAHTQTNLPPPQPKLTSGLDCGPVLPLRTYGGRILGTIRWSNPDGQRGLVTICSGRASPFGEVSGNLPGGVRVILTPDPWVSITEPPSEKNGWARFAFETDGRIPRIEFRWRVIQ